MIRSPFNSLAQSWGWASFEGRGLSYANSIQPASLLRPWSEYRNGVVETWNAVVDISRRQTLKGVYRERFHIFHRFYSGEKCDI